MIVARHVLDDVLAHAAEDAPRECCGILLGRDGCVVQHVRAVNLADGTTRFLIDPRDHVRAIREGRARQFEVVGFYHSHPRSPAYPSETDLAESVYPGAVHLIVGVRDGRQEARLFAIEPPRVVELPLTVEQVGRQSWPAPPS